MSEDAITHSCGHTVRHTHTGDERARAKRVAWLQKQPCQKCFQAKQAEASRAQAEALGLPDLTGSEEDCAWAATIRSKAITHNQEYVDRVERGAARASDLDEAAKTAAAAAKSAYDTLCAQSSAQWWIDHRFESADYVREETAKAVQKALDSE